MAMPHAFILAASCSLVLPVSIAYPFQPISFLVLSFRVFINNAAASRIKLCWGTQTVCIAVSQAFCRDSMGLATDSAALSSSCSSLLAVFALNLNKGAIIYKHDESI